MQNKIFQSWLERIKDDNIINELKTLTKQQIQDNFGKSLAFGTSGIRGTMELGTNNINELTICKLAKAVSDYVNQYLSNKSVVVCFDTRLNSKKFSRIFAKVLVQNHIKVHLFLNFAPTPLCVYATTKLNAGLGVMITASHNRREYNGVKVYDKDGISINTDTQQKISDLYNKTDEVMVYNGIIDYNINNKVNYIRKDIQDAFVDREFDKNLKNLKIIYTPLNGTGYYCVKRLFTNNGFKCCTPKSQTLTDGMFSTCPYPNPEFMEAFDESVKLAKMRNADIIVATDPDADRIGVVVRHNKEYIHLSGNELGYIFADYLTKKGGKFIVTTVVTSPLINKICQANNAKLFKTLTGFMSIGNKTKECVGLLGANNHALSYEESCGYIVRNDYFDKDGIFASLKICQIASELKSQGKTLIDYLNDIYAKCGYIAEHTENIIFQGTSAVEDMQTTINNIRNKKISRVLDSDIIKIIDYLQDDTGLPKQNFIEYRAPDFTFIIRPSGTEPKIKIYMFYKGEKDTANKKIIELFKEIKRLFF